jgi:hypothetical protein
MSSYSSQRIKVCIDTDTESLHTDNQRKQGDMT